MAEQRAPTWYEVPAGTAGKPCRAKDCDATIYMVPSTKTPGAFVPVDCGVEKGCAPTANEAGLGVNHYATCKDPRRFHKPKAVIPPREDHSQRELPVEHRPPACIVCGCTAAKPCQIDREELDLVGQDLMMERHDAEQLSDLPRTVSCSWITTDPPVCNAPACRRARAEMPLRMKVGGAR